VEGAVVDVVGATVGAASGVGATGAVVVGEVGATVVVEGSVDGGISYAVEFAEPGCARATATPMTAVAPVAAKAAVKVRRRILAWARAGDTPWSNRRSPCSAGFTVLVAFCLASDLRPNSAPGGVVRPPEVEGARRAAG
jgi:hypothetical protein